MQCTLFSAQLLFIPLRSLPRLPNRQKTANTYKTTHYEKPTILQVAFFSDFSHKYMDGTKIEVIIADRN